MTVKEFENLNLKLVHTNAEQQNVGKENIWNLGPTCAYLESYDFLLGRSKFYLNKSFIDWEAGAIKEYWDKIYQGTSSQSEGLREVTIKNNIPSPASYSSSTVDAWPSWDIETTFDSEELEEDVQRDAYELEQRLLVVEAVTTVVRRQRGIPRKLKTPFQVHTPKRPRGRPRKDAGSTEASQLLRDGYDLHLMSLDWHSEEGVKTRARLALIRSQCVGMLFDCLEEITIQGIVRKIRAGFTY